MSPKLERLIARASERLSPVAKDAPTKREQALAEELRTRLEALDEGDISTSSANASWQHNMQQLRKLAMEDDARRFLRWPVIHDTMFVTYSQSLGRELKFLQSLPDWSSRWRAGIREAAAGSPPRYPFYRDSSGTLIHHAYHLAHYEQLSGKKIDEHELIVEFGGGYGSLCRLAHQLGFQGSYAIFDLPHFSALQCYFLKSLELPVIDQAPEVPGRGIFCLSELGALESLVAAAGDTCQQGLFFASFSLSESPEAIREAVLSRVLPLQHYFFAYQDVFENIDNIQWFKYWRDHDERNLCWQDIAMPVSPSCRYLCGVPQN